VDVIASEGNAEPVVTRQRLHACITLLSCRSTLLTSVGNNLTSCHAGEHSFDLQVRLYTSVFVCSFILLCIWVYVGQGDD